ncbi:MAG: 4-hydroxy-3-methylbut-2-enyl diphosphate reductase [bacterium]|nr:4-hydroxy-3-methylbut-2-enyl diphosphate reductase [bacterium]MDE0439641.1 4-hydroxy-3-methylbut-2-enyl diphosphate reductase [bacterium]
MSQPGLSPSRRPTRVLLAEPNGFCAGVDMAIKALVWMAKIFEPPVYCYHEIVHNRFVVESFEKAGVVFVDSIDEVPEGAPVMLSAHGSAPEVLDAANHRAGVVIDAVCPLVTKIHHEVKRAAAKDFDILFVGHHGHDEAVGTLARAPGSITLVEPETGFGSFVPRNPEKVALFAQTTLGLHEWKAMEAEANGRFPNLVTARKSDLCYATTNRQDAVRAMTGECDLILVVGSVNSSNTNALVRTADVLGTPAYRIDRADGIRDEWLEGAEVVGVTAGASAPDVLVQEVLERLDPVEGWHLFSVTDEEEYFPLPPGLRKFVGALTHGVQLGLTARPDGRGPLDYDRNVTPMAALGSLRVYLGPD